MAQAESAIEDIRTPPKPNTRSKDEKTPEPPTPGAPIKEALVRDAEQQFEMAIMLQSVANRLFVPHKDDVSPADTILQKLWALPEAYHITSPIGDDRIFQVVDMTPDEVVHKICTLQVHARGNNSLYPLQSRAEGSQQFSTELDSWVLRRGKEFNRSLVNKITVLDNITAELLLLVFELCQKKTLMKLREIYYRNTELYQSPGKVGEVADDLCCLIGCTRSSLGITANEKGLFYGDVSFSVAKEDGSKKHYDGLSNDNGTIIPAAKFNDIGDIKSKALFILVVEKGTVFERLLQDGFCDTYKCIIITAKGMPDVMTRGFLSIFARMLKLRVFALMDCNPDGLKIYGIYRYGSRAKSYDRKNLTTPGIELLGIRHSHIDEYQIPKGCMEKMTKKDCKTVKELLALDCMKEYHGDLRSMRNRNRKIQIEAFHAHGITYLAKVALPRMLDRKLTQLHDSPLRT